jgi:hypothetical protein
MKFRIDNDTLTIMFQGTEQFWALKHKMVVPKVNIVRAQWQQATTVPRRELGWRFGGTALPGLLFAGRFMGSQSTNFVYVQRPQGLFGDLTFQHVLTLELRNSGYKRLFFTINKPDIAEQIIAWWSGNV